MTTTIIVICTSERFQSDHPELAKRATCGYLGLTVDALNALSHEVRDSLRPAKRPWTITGSIAGGTA